MTRKTLEYLRDLVSHDKRDAALAYEYAAEHHEEEEELCEMWRQYKEAEAAEEELRYEGV